MLKYFNSGLGIVCLANIRDIRYGLDTTQLVITYYGDRGAVILDFNDDGSAINGYRQISELLSAVEVETS